MTLPLEIELQWQVPKVESAIALKPVECPVGGIGKPCTSHFTII